MELILASILTLFLNKEEGNKILACLFTLYLVLLEYITYSEYPTFQDYLNIYTFLTSGLFLALFVYTKRDYVHKLLILSVILPHIYYLVVLHKPYLLSTSVPMWWVLYEESIFLYGVVFIFYEQSMEFSFKDMKFKDFIISATILILLIV